MSPVGSGVARALFRPQTLPKDTTMSGALGEPAPQAEKTVVEVDDAGAPEEEIEEDPSSESAGEDAEEEESEDDDDEEDIPPTSSKSNRSRLAGEPRDQVCLPCWSSVAAGRAGDVLCQDVRGSTGGRCFMPFISGMMATRVIWPLSEHNASPTIASIYGGTVRVSSLSSYHGTLKSQTRPLYEFSGLASAIMSRSYSSKRHACWNEN